MEAKKWIQIFHGAWKSSWWVFEWLGIPCAHKTTSIEIKRVNSRKKSSSDHFYACTLSLIENTKWRRTWYQLRKIWYYDRKFPAVFVARFLDFRNFESDFNIFSNPFNREVHQSSGRLHFELIDSRLENDWKKRFDENDLVNFYKQYVLGKSHNFCRRHPANHLTFQCFSKIKFC